ncbi:MAG TPA: hypothetical protein DEV59_04120 [Proteus sp.]|nr:hypothetical protein [Proteus sp. (in: enterobacteria)]
MKQCQHREITFFYRCLFDSVLLQSHKKEKDHEQISYLRKDFLPIMPQQKTDVTRQKDIAN